MSKCLKAYPLVLCILLWNICIASAQESKEKESGKTYRITLFNKWKGPEVFIKKKSYVPLQAHKMAYTKPFRYPLGEPIVIYSKIISEKGEEKYMPYLNIRVPTSIIEPLLVLFWDSQKKKAGGKIVEFSNRVFRYGTYQLVNLSNTMQQFVRPGINPAYTGYRRWRR